MSGGNDRLTVKGIDSWIKAGTAGKLSDGGGLYLKRLPSGAATWQLKYRAKVDGALIERVYSIGPWPGTTLKDAREARQVAKDLIKQGKDPVQARRVDKAAEQAASGVLFGDLATDWLKKESAGWSFIHQMKSSRALEIHALPRLGKLPVASITPTIVCHVIEAVEKDGKRDTAAKLLQHVRAIFRFAQARGLRNDNPADAAIEVLGPVKQVRHRPALLTFPELRQVLASAEMTAISPGVRLCHRLVAFTAVRIGNAVAARWEHFDLAAGLWTIPRAEMKVNKGRSHDHKVIIPAPMLAALVRWHDLQGQPADGYVFPGNQGRSFVSRESVEKALHAMGYKDRHTVHGWRASFSTLAKDAGHPTEAVDLALDHVHASDVARAYDRGQRMVERQALAAWWGEQLEAKV